MTSPLRRHFFFDEKFPRRCRFLADATSRQPRLAGKNPAPTVVGVGDDNLLQIVTGAEKTFVDSHANANERRAQVGGFDGENVDVVSLEFVLEGGGATELAFARVASGGAEDGQKHAGVGAGESGVAGVNQYAVSLH